MGITKNRQTESVIRRMALAAFPNKRMESCTELTEGMCNAAYLVHFTDGSRSVLKIAPADKKGLMSNEVGLMDAEVSAMRIVRGNGAVRVADVQYYDRSRTVCDSSYFFMEMLEGQSYVTVKDQFTEEEQAVIHHEIGVAERKITSIAGEKFGLLGEEGCRYHSLYDFVLHLISNVISDAKRKNIAAGVPFEEILAGLQADRRIFEEVTQPVLVHWDMWEGNIFVKEKHISGIIDWERAMWGEALMDDRFRRHTRTPQFLKGYGKEYFTAAEMRRIHWYDVFLYLTMMTEGAFRGYEDDSQYRWVKPLFDASWNDLNQTAANEKKEVN